MTLNESIPRPQRILRAALLCLLTCLCVPVLLAAVYAVRGIWPFGTDNVAYVDTVQFYLPTYYKIWDALHGNASAVTWTAGLAEGFALTRAVLCNPASLAFLFVGRGMVLEGLSLYLGIWLIEIAFAASIVVQLRFPRLPAVWKILLPLCYAFSGWVLQYYANFSWLKMAALFPLVLYGAERLLREGKFLVYLFALAFFTYQSVYFAYMALAFLLVFSFAYLLFLVPRQQRGARVLTLGLSTAAALGLTANWTVSYSSSITSSSRFESNLDSGITDGFSTWDLTATRHTALMLLGLSFAAALLLCVWLQRRDLPEELRARRRAAARFYALSLGLIAVPMVFTNIDTAWHFGQYNFFPMRWGYMAIALVLSGAAVLLQAREENFRLAPGGTLTRPSGTGKKIFLSVIAVLLSAALCVIVPRLCSIWQRYGAVFLTAMGTEEYYRCFALYVGAGALYAALYFLLFRLRNRRTGTILVTVLLVLELGANACGHIAPDDDHTTTREYSPAWVDTADALYEWSQTADIDAMTRVKNADASLGAAYPVTAGLSALSSVNSGNSSLRLGVFRELGYTVNYCRIMDTGGTVFSDMLLNVRYALTADSPDPDLYTDTGTEIDGIHISQSNYPGLLGLQFPSGALDDYLDLLTLSDRLNALYRAFTGRADALACEPSATVTAGDGAMQTVTAEVTLDEPSVLYLSSDLVMMNIMADGKAVTVPSYENTDNRIYPAAFNQNQLCLGCFDAGTVTLTFQTAMQPDADALTFTALSREALDDFYDIAYYDTNTTVVTEDDRTALTLTAEGDDMMLFLPLAYHSWTCTVNGTEVTPQCVLGTMVAVPLRAGINTVVLSCPETHFTFTGAFLVTVLSALAAAGALIYLHRRRHPLPAGFGIAAQAVYYAACAGAFAFLYITPTVYLITRGTIVSF